MALCDLHALARGCSVAERVTRHCHGQRSQDSSGTNPVSDWALGLYVDLWEGVGGPVFFGSCTLHTTVPQSSFRSWGREVCQASFPRR